LAGLRLGWLGFGGLGGRFGLGGRLGLGGGLGRRLLCGRLGLGGGLGRRLLCGGLLFGRDLGLAQRGRVRIALAGVHSAGLLLLVAGAARGEHVVGQPVVGHVRQVALADVLLRRQVAGRAQRQDLALDALDRQRQAAALGIDL